MADALKTLKGRKPKIAIGVLTDGYDNSSQSHSADDVKKLMQYLQEEKMIKSSVVIGWTDDGDLQEKDLLNLKDNMGFNEYISLNKTDPSSIRNAFNLWSQRVI